MRVRFGSALMYKMNTTTSHDVIRFGSALVYKIQRFFHSRFMFQLLGLALEFSIRWHNVVRIPIELRAGQGTACGMNAS